MKRNFKYILLAFISMGVLASCADLEVENINAPDRERALSNPEDLLSLLNGATTDVMFDQQAFVNVHVNGLADQITGTNNAYSFWAHTDQPRRPLQNFTTFADLFIYSDSWNTCNSTISSANLVLKSILTDNVVLEDGAGNDVTDEALLGAYFARGMALGIIGTMYDRGYVVKEDTELSTVELQPYNTIIEAAIEDMDLAIELASNNNVGWTFFPTTDYSSSEFIEIASSYAARFLMSSPRTAEEANALGDAYWDRVLSYANAGLTTDFMPPGQDGVIWANTVDWTQYLLSDGAGYIPVDQKIAWLFDPVGQPKDYPLDNTVLPQANTPDDREELYYDYTTAFGYLRADRNRALFSNYALARWDNLGNEANYSASFIPFFLKAEVDYIKAECELRKGNTDAALALINNGPRSTVGGLEPSTDNTTSNVLKLLFYEYSIELDCTGKAIQLAMMRRFDLLQRGTPTHYPVPASELETLGVSTYTYGGEANIDEGNTAGGEGWRASSF